MDARRASLRASSPGPLPSALSASSFRPNEEEQIARGTVVGGKSLAVRQEMSKSSAKIGSVDADSEIDVLELARTQTGTLRAKVSWNAKDGEEQVGWATATTNTGKQILDIEGADGALAPVLEAEAQPDGAEPEPEPEPDGAEPEPQEGGEQRRDLPDMDEDELTPPVEDDTFRKVFEGRSEFLDLAGPFWSKKRCPEGPLGRGWEGPRDFISEELLPMFEEVDSYDARYEYALVDDVRRTTMWLEIGHEDGSYSKLLVYACEPQKKKKRKMEASTHFELWRLSPRPPTSKKGQQENAKKFGKAVVQFCASALGRKVGNGECWTLGERALHKAKAAPPDACTSLSCLRLSPSPAGASAARADTAWRADNFGDPVEPSEARPGDIMQFTSCRFGKMTVAQSRSSHACQLANPHKRHDFRVAGGQPQLLVHGRNASPHRRDREAAAGRRRGADLRCLRAEHQAEDHASEQV